MYNDPTKQAVITVVKNEPRTSKNNKSYYLVTDAKQDMYSDWDDHNIQEGKTYAIFYTEQTSGGKTYKTIKQASEIDESPAEEGIRRESRERQNSIIRQHSQEMSLRYFQARNDTEFTLDALKEMIDWFENDAQCEEEPF